LVSKPGSILARAEALLSELYERSSVLLTNNLAFSKWEGIFKDPMTTAAAIDRLVHHSVIVELNIPSHRMEEAKRIWIRRRQAMKLTDGRRPASVVAGRYAGFAADSWLTLDIANISPSHSSIWVSTSTACGLS